MPDNLLGMGKAESNNTEMAAAHVTDFFAQHLKP
jgi:hypothetical protein